MNRSESIGALTKALAAAQAEIKDAIKASENPYFKSRYADLASVTAAIREPLAKHDLATIQLPETTLTEGKVGVRVTTVLAHSSGEWIAGELTLYPKLADPQAMGSAITYGRRYGLAAIVGVVAVDEDDDGNMSNGKYKPQSPDDVPPFDSRHVSDPGPGRRGRNKPTSLPEPVDDTLPPAEDF